jgi:hypothetical protein
MSNPTGQCFIPTIQTHVLYCGNVDIKFPKDPEVYSALALSNQVSSNSDTITSGGLIEKNVLWQDYHVKYSDFIKVSQIKPNFNV